MSNRKSGEKVNRASIWNIPVLNHLYLEDCFIKWRRLPEAGDHRYTDFPYGVNFMTLLGDARLTDADLEPWTAPAKDIDDDDDMQEIDGDITATGITAPTQVSEGSQRDRTIRQVAPGDLPAEMNIDTEEVPSRPPSAPIVEEPHQPLDSVQHVSEEPVPGGDNADQDQPMPKSDTTEMTPLSDETPQPGLPLPQDGPSKTVSSPLSGGPDDGADIPQAVEHDQGLGDFNDDGPDDVMHGIEEAVEKDAGPVSPEPKDTVEPARPATAEAHLAEEDIVPLTTQAKGKAPAKTAKKSRSNAATTTQPTKRPRLSTPEKRDAPVASQPVFEGRARRQAATKAADMLHNVIAPDMALHDKEKKRKDIVSPKSRRAAWVGGNAEGSSHKAKQGSVATEEEESTEDEPDVKLQVRGTQRGGKKATTSSRGRSRSTIIRDTARSGTRSLSVLSGLSGDEEDREGDLNPTHVRLMTTGFTLEDKLTKVSSCH